MRHDSAERAYPERRVQTVALRGTTPCELRDSEQILALDSGQDLLGKEAEDGGGCCTRACVNGRGDPEGRSM